MARIHLPTDRRTCFLISVRATALLSAFVMLLASGCRRETGRGITVVASTANVSAIVKAIGGERVSVTTIAPAGMCPGHFDVRPSDIAAVNRAKLAS